MNEMIINQADFRALIKTHQANLSVYQAKTESEVIQAIQESLRSCPFITAYYAVINNELVSVITFDPATHGPFEISLEKQKAGFEWEEKQFSKEIRFTSPAEADLPEVIKKVFASKGCNRLTALPVIRNGELSGLLIVAARPMQILNLDMVAPLKELTDIIPISLDNLDAGRGTNQRLKELEAIAETGQIISSYEDLESLYKTLHTQIQSSIGNVDILIALYNSQNETIEFPYVSEEGSIKSIEPFPLGEGVISVLIRTQQPLMLVDDAERRLNALGAKVIGKPAKSWLGCPLLVATGAIGAIVVQDLDNEKRFDQDDLNFLSELSLQAAKAINNIHLLEKNHRNALELETVAEISREVSSSLIIDELLHRAVTLLYERFNYYLAGIYLVDTNGEYVVIREAIGETGIQLKRSAHKVAVGSKSIIGFVTDQKELLVVNDIIKDPDYDPNPLLPETRSEACFPLKVGERILGVLDVQSQHPYAFTSENIKILQILADQLAIAVVNSELFADAQERLSQHRLLHHVTTAAASSSSIQEALLSTVQGLQVALGGDQISIMMADKEQMNLEVKASIGYPNEESARLKVPFGVGVTGWVAAHRQSLRIGDVTKDSRYISVNPKVRSELAIPLVYRNEVLGIVNVESGRLSAYNENDEEMLGTLAGSLAAIIAHSRLLDQYRQQVERERLLSEITNKIRRTTNPALILSITADEISKALNTRRTQVEISLQNMQRNNDDLSVEELNTDQRA
jgi:GAF domain-containing protein